MFGSRTSDLLVIFGIECLIFSCLLCRKWFTMPIWRIFIRNIPLCRRWKNGRWKHCLFCLVAKNTIEEKIVQLHATKRDMADAMLEGTDQSARLSTADLLALLREV